MERDFKGVWIDKAIWLDKSLGWSEKLLLVEIDSFARRGECFATNEYFGTFFDLSKDRISKIISELVRKGYIETKLIYYPGTKNVEKRVITTRGYRRKQLEGIGENNDTPPGENAEDINTSFINSGINQEERSKAIASPPPPPVRIGNDGISRFEIIKESSVGFPPVRKNFLELRDDNRREILATLSHYSNDEIASALKTYAAMLKDDQYDIFAPYASLIGFLRSGVEKFVDEAKPREVFRKRDPEALEKAKRDAVFEQMKREHEEADDDE